MAFVSSVIPTSTDLSLILSFSSPFVFQKDCTSRHHWIRHLYWKTNVGVSSFKYSSRLCQGIQIPNWAWLTAVGRHRTNGYGGTAYPHWFSVYYNHYWLFFVSPQEFLLFAAQMNQDMESSNKSVLQTSDFPIFSTAKYFEHIVLLYWVVTACILKKKETWIEDKVQLYQWRRM